jgi:uncharacterized protein YbjT (DUF2867 family)
MSNHQQPILVFGATGQQGGSVANALLAVGWKVRALVRDPGSPKSVALRDAGVELVPGDLADPASIREATTDVYGVFSVQPSSGQGALYGVSDEDEVRYGITIADIAVESDAGHLVYSSTNAVGDEPTGMGHFDSKARIEAHVRHLPITTTIIRPAAFMEMLMMPGFGLDENRFNFFTQPDQSIQLVAVEDIGKIVAAIFDDPERFGGTTLEVASDAVTGHDLEALYTEAAVRPVTYARFTDDVLVSNPFLSGRADLETLRKINPDLLSFRSWLAGSGRQAFAEALGASGAWSYGHT